MGTVILLIKAIILQSLFFIVVYALFDKFYLWDRLLDRLPSPLDYVILNVFHCPLCVTMAFSTVMIIGGIYPSIISMLTNIRILIVLDILIVMYISSFVYQAIKTLVDIDTFQN